MSRLYARVSLCAIMAAVLTSRALADDLLVVDLSVTNQITISATGGLSAATVSGTDFTGVYLDNFYGAAGTSLSATVLPGADLTTAANPTSGSQDLFRGGSGTDSGLNIWDLSTDSDLDFTGGSLAFVGSATWTLNSEDYTEMLAGPVTGDLYFPADTGDDIGSATLLGTWRVVPEPASVVLLGLCAGFGALRRRR